MSPNQKKRAVFLDRDGVLNKSIVRDGKPYSPSTLDEMEIPADAAQALQRLKAAGYLLICVTNQPEVARGNHSRQMVEALNAKAQRVLSLDEVRVCWHDDPDNCDCRKPKAGLLLGAAKDHNIDLAASFMVGDRWRDVAAGHGAGCKTILIEHNYAEEWKAPSPHHTTRSLSGAAAWILENNIMNTNSQILSQLKVKLFADGADKAGMLEMYRNPWIKGFTTNPTLMRKAGVSDYEAFARDILAAIPDRSISLEVFSDEFDEMKRQALKIAKWGANVYVKIPVTNTRDESSIPLIRELSHSGVKVNVTAMLALDQVRDVTAALAGGAPSYVSVFAGRVADTGRDPVPLMAAAMEYLKPHAGIEMIWASPRELLNVFQADAVGCHIITATNDILKKLELVGRDLHEYSLDTVKMFRNDAVKAGFAL